MGAAEGSIMATIMPAHMATTATAVSRDHAVSSGIIDRMRGCAMSSVIQATNAQLATKTSPIAVQSSA